jgi:two-component system response regulator AtoC
VIPIVVPPLRERSEDIAPLARSFLTHFNVEFHKSLSGFAEGVLDALRAYAWPGNVRELRNAIERADAARGRQRNSSSTTCRLELRDSTQPRAISRSGVDSFTLPPEGLLFEELEKHLLIQALERCRGNRTRAARLLGMNRDRIRYRIQKFGLEERYAESDG